MAKLRNLFVKISFGLVLLGGLFFGPTHAPSVVYAQNTAPVLGGQAAPAVSGTNQIQPGDTGLQTIQQTSGLGSTPFTVIIANIIRIFLSLMGVIVIGVIIYGGFTYMTAGGSEETAEKAKRILTNGVIGLVIVLSSFGISEFIIRSFLTATGSPLANGGGGTTDVGIGGGTGLGGGGGSGFGALTVNFGSPRGLQKFANIRVNVVFNQAVDESTVSYGSNFIVTNKAGTKVDGAVTVDADTITFIPSKSCPAPNDSLHCFDPDEYNVSLVGGLSTSIHAAVTGKILVCTGVNCKFTFTAGTDIDTTAPNISNTTPPDNGKIPSESFVPVKALLSDNDGIAYGRILVDGKLLETVQPVYPAGNTGQQLYIISQKFNTKGDAPGTAHVIEVDAMDVAGNLGKAQIHTTSYAAHCFNKVQSVNGVTDPTEIAIDCSAANGECGLCANSACTASSQCAGGNGFCDPVKHVCSSSPIIKDVQPQDGAPGSYITISGDGFGTNFGSVTFLGDPKTDTDDVEAPLACDAGWSNDQVVVRVPDGAKSGAIQIKNSATSIDTTDNQTGLYLQQFKITDVVRPGICGLIPDSGFSGTKVSLLGTDDISSPSVDRKLFFGGYSANDATWAQITPNTITATLPDMDPGFINVQAVIKGITTNPLEFLVTASSTATTGKGPANPDNVLSLNSVAPAAGGVGTYVTLTGTGFGTVPNKVYFVVLDGSGNPTDQQVVADTNFPAQCAAGFWGNKQIIVKVPNIPVAKYGIRVYPYGNKTGSNIQNFTVNTDKPGPQVCAIKADNGPANGSLVISFFGEHFGTTPGVAIFSDHVVGLAPKTGSIWTDGKVNIMVPASAVSGGVRLSLVINGKATKNICDTNPSTCSNSVYFAVSDCRVVAGACKTGNICCADGSCGTSCISASKKVSAAFLWCFSTGDSCAVSQPPEIKEECNTLATATNSIPSPSPSSVWPSTVSACNNAQIAIKFTENIDPKTVNVFSGSKSSIIVEKCTGDISDPCTQTDPTLVSLKNLKVSAYSTSAYSSIFVTPQNLAISSTYRVSISNQIAGIDSGLPVRAPADQLSTCKPGSGFVYCFTFSTGPTNEPCLIDKVGIDPPSFVTQNLGTIVDAKQNRVYWSPVPYPVDHCQILDPSVYQWGWKPSQAVDSNFLIAAALNPTAATTLLDAKTPTKDGASIDITASTMQQGALKTGTGTLVINPGPPRIYEQCSIDGIRSPSPSIMWSAATPVCRTSLVSVTFNQPVVLLNADKTESPFTFSLFQCTGTKKDHECDTAVATATTDFTPTTMNADDNVYQYTIEPKAPLFLNTTYIAEVSTNTKGVGVNGKMMVPMKGCPVGVGYCFTFKTAATLIDNDAACKLASIELSPGNYTTTDYGTVQQLLNGSWTPLAWIAQGFGADKCVYLDPNAFTFNWGIDLAHAGYAAVDPDNKWSDTGWAQYIAAYKETGDSPLSILATAQNITGSSLLSVAFTNPHITSYDPLDCPGSTSGVCLNSLVDITFSTNINLDSLQNKLFLYECPATTNLTTDDCAFADSDLKNALVPTIDANDNHHVLFASQNFDPQRKYRLVLKGGVLSDAGLPFADFNYPATNAQYFTWTFITGTAACAIDHVNVKPVDAIAQAQGQVQQFLVGAFGQADACHPDGQPLNPNAYTWSWTSSVPLVAQETAASSTPDHAFSINANGPVVNGFQSTNITAQTMGKSDTVPWKLVCNASAISCPAGTQVGKDGCCYKQLGFDTVYPDPNATDICRNTLITAHVNELVDTTTVSSTSFMVGYATDAATCAGGDYRGGFCYKKLPYTVDVVNHTNSKADPSTSEALLTASVGDMLPANTQVKVMISKTNLTDAANADYSVLANSGVAVTGQSWTFTTGPNPCALNKVQIFPDQINFQKLNAPEEAIAYGLSHQGNRDVPLAAISGKYDWTWNWASQFVKVAKIDPIEKKTQQKTEMVAGGQNGKTFVTGLAKIVSDIYFDPSTKGHDVVGRLPVWAAICDTPWYSDAQTPLTDILNGQNMSFWYCETPTGQKPLPHLVPIIDPVADTSANAADVYTVLNAFHLTDPTTGAAVGFRIEKNLKNYSPLEWYYQKEFKGDVTPQVVAGLDAVRVANTLYVAYGNQSTNSSYTNMLIISLSDPATPELQAIFDQILANLQTSTNLVDDGLCYQGAEASTQQCNKDADCPTVPQTPLTPVQMASRVFVNTNELSGTGSDANLKSGIRCSITFDAAGSHFQAMVYDAAQKKISFQTDPVYAKIVADAQNVLPLDCNNSGPSGLCSTASTPGPISCYSSADCPSNGTCVMPATPTTCQIPYTKFIRDTNRVIDVATLTRSLEKAHAFANKYPVVATGSFVPGLTASTWPQWTDFMSQLGIAQVVDPLNSYAGCTGDFDTATCWNAKSQKYQCNPGSEAYHYRTINSGADYQLGISFEQDSSLTNNWAGYIKDTVLASGRVNLSFCTGNTYVADAVCGDGSIGGSEQCDPPGKTVTINDSTTYGSSTAVCTSQCKYGPQTPVTLCGDGIIQVGVETCDDGKALNGKYNHCPADCGVKSKVLVSSLGACGDGIIQPGVEMCEINSGVGAVTIGSKYAINQVDSCNWDCKAYGPYCGDGTVNADHGEDCDGDQTDYANSCVRKCNKHTDANPCKWTNATAGVPVCEKIQTTPGTPTTPPGCGDGK